MFLLKMQMKNIIKEEERKTHIGDILVMVLSLLFLILLVALVVLLVCSNRKQNSKPRATRTEN